MSLSSRILLRVIGGLWMLLWQTRWRRAGAMPLMIGIAALLATPRPDLLVTGDGRHIAAAQPDGSYALLRDRAGDYVRDTVAEAAGIDAPLRIGRAPCRERVGEDR